jgi:hypothetical protein
LDTTRHRAGVRSGPVVALTVGDPIDYQYAVTNTGALPKT